MNNQAEVKTAIVDLLGNKPMLTVNHQLFKSNCFANPEKLKALNAIVHPGSQRLFCLGGTTKAPFVIKEVAILFETGGYKCGQNRPDCSARDHKN